MSNYRFALKYPLIAAAVAVLLTGCGGGGGGGGDSLRTAAFVNAPVQGLTVLQDDRSETTNADGEFRYDPDGGAITFRLGSLTLGSAPPPTGAVQRVTPFDLGDEERALNIAQFLQSFDYRPEGINVSGFAEAFASDGILQFELSAADFEAALGTLLLEFPNVEVRKREDASAALTQGTSVGFSAGDFNEKVFYFEVVGTDSLDDKGFIAFDGPTSGSLDAFSDFIDNGGDGFGTDFTWEIDSSGRLVLEAEGDSEGPVVLSRIFRVVEDGVTRFRVGAPGDDPVDLYQSRPFMAAMLEGNGFDVEIDGEAGWVDFGTETFQFESDDTPQPFDWEILFAGTFGVLQLESGGDTTWFLRFRDLADEGFEAFYLDVEPASDGSDDVIFVDGGWVTFTPRSGSGGS